MMLASDRRCAVITEYEEPKTNDLVDLHRPVLGQKLIFPEDGSVIAVASDESLQTDSLPLLNLNEPEEVAGIINCWLDKRVTEPLKRAN
jgi:hypothetical protein